MYVEFHAVNEEEVIKLLTRRVGIAEKNRHVAEMAALQKHMNEPNVQ